MSKLRVLRYVALHPGATGTVVRNGTALPTAFKLLREMEQAGLVRADNAREGKSIPFGYHLNEDAILDGLDELVSWVIGPELWEQAKTRGQKLL